MSFALRFGFGLFKQPPHHLSQDWLHILFDLLHCDLILKNRPSWSVSWHFLLKKWRTSNIRNSRGWSLYISHCSHKSKNSIRGGFADVSYIWTQANQAMVLGQHDKTRRGSVTMAKIFQPLIPDVWSILRRRGVEQWPMTTQKQAYVGWVEQWVGQSTDDNAETGLGGVFGERHYRPIMWQTFEFFCSFLSCIRY